MTLLQEIQRDVADPSLSLQTILRKADTLADHLAGGVFKEWVEMELNGYPDNEQLPCYRVLLNPCIHGDFQDPVESRLTNLEIPATAFPKKFQKHIGQARMVQGVSFYEDFVKCDSKDSLPMRLPPELRGQIQDKVYENMECLEAWQLVSRSAIVNLLDTVRNGLLDFTREIKAAHPTAGEKESGSISELDVWNVFQTTIGKGGFYLNPFFNIFPRMEEIREGDFSSLKDFLRLLGLNDAALNELRRAIKEDDPPKSGSGGWDWSGNNELTDWIAKMAADANKGAIKAGYIPDPAGGVILAHALCRYYGYK